MDVLWNDPLVSVTSNSFFDKYNSEKQLTMYI
jgi:hypothetical protein